MRAWLKNIRTDAGLLQNDMAEKLGISQPHYCDIELGKRQQKMDLAIANKLSVILNIPIDKIIEYEGIEQS